MSLGDLENALRDLPSVGTKVKDRGYRQIWRFQHAGRAYYLKFYPRLTSALRRVKHVAAGNPAVREFTRLQRLQKADIPAPRAVAVLMGFRLAGELGDAVVLDAIEPSVTLDRHLNGLQLEGRRPANHRQLAGQVTSLVHKLGKAGLGHSDLHLGNLLLQGEKVYLLDGYAVRPGGLRMRDVLQLGHSVARYATRADVVRGWDALGNTVLPPDRNPVSTRVWRKFIEAARGPNRYFGTIRRDGGWGGVFFSQFKYPHRWAPASQLHVTSDDWGREWPVLLGKIERDELEVLKRSRSGDVLAGEVTLAGRAVPVVIKRPRRRYWYRYLNEIGRGSRARRAWFKAWNLVTRNLPTAWPLLLMERRSLGYVTDQLFVCERVPGPTLAAVDLDAMRADWRDVLFRRTGKILRRIERFGFSHFDAKASNWIVRADDVTGPQPVLVDVDGIRRRQWVALGVQRLLRSMREHAQYTPADSLALCQGYAPFTRFIAEGTGP